MAAPPRILLALAAYATAAHFEFTNPKISQCAIDGKRSGVPWLTKNDAHYICTDANWDALYDPASSIAYASMNPGDGPIELKCPNASQALKCFIFSSWGQAARGVPKRPRASGRSFVGRRRARQLHGQVLHGIARGRAILLRQGLHGPGELPRERRRQVPGQRLAPGARGRLRRRRRRLLRLLPGLPRLRPPEERERVARREPLLRLPPGSGGVAGLRALLEQLPRLSRRRWPGGLHARGRRRGVPRVVRLLPLGQARRADGGLQLVVLVRVPRRGLVPAVLRAAGERADPAHVEDEDGGALRLGPC